VQAGCAVIYLVLRAFEMLNYMILKKCFNLSSKKKHENTRALTLMGITGLIRDGRRRRQRQRRHRVQWSGGVCVGDTHSHTHTHTHTPPPPGMACQAE